MKKLIFEIGTGKNSKLTFLLIISLFIFVGLACKIGNRKTSEEENTVVKTVDSPKTSTDSDSQDSDTPPKSEVDSLVKDTMAEFADAVDKGDFSDFHANTSKDFQATYKPAELNKTFRVFIDKKNQVLPSMNGISETTAVFTDSPRVRTEKGYKVLVANGYFPTSPNKVQFESEYELEKGDWKILKIRVKL